MRGEECAGDRVLLWQVQEESNRAAAMFDKASSQYAAAKEMIRVTEGELANSIPETSEEGKVVDESVSHALLEVLNHATRKVGAVIGSDV